MTRGSIPVLRGSAANVFSRRVFRFSLALFSLLATGLVCSLWIENRYSDDDSGLAFRRVLTKPVANAVSQQIGRFLRNRLDAQRFFLSGLTLEQTISRLLDERVSWSERRIYAYRLASVGTPEAVAALLEALAKAPPEHRAFMAQLIGSAGNPAAKDWLWPLLKDSDERVVMGAIHGLSAIGGEEVCARIKEILSDPQSSNKVRAEAAAGLGEIGTTAARDALAAAFASAVDDEVAAQIASSLGKFPFPAVAEIFDSYLSNAETPSENRVAAVESLANSTREAVPFLMGLAADEADADVRAAAAWSVGALGASRNGGPALTALAEQESEPDVRRRVYEALVPQTQVPSDRLLTLVLAEEDIAARVAGFNAIGSDVGRNRPANVSAVFDAQMVPELLSIALAPNSLNIQMRAVFALRRAGTASANEALAVIASGARSEVATAARNGLRIASN